MITALYVIGILYAISTIIMAAMVIAYFLGWYKIDGGRDD